MITGKVEQPFKALCGDIKGALEANENGPSFYELYNGVRVYTHDSSNPSLNRNGGDYDYYTDYVIVEGTVCAFDDWSAEFDPCEWNVYDKREYCMMSARNLFALVQRIAAHMGD
jgi:hypothetical protein